MRVLVCGGAGYIGSHACVVLAERGHDPVVVDNFCNSSPVVLERLAGLIGRPLEHHRIDVRDTDAMTALLAAGRFEAVVHFAALKAVGESCEKPLEYFDNNIAGTISLLRAMRAADVRRLVFSSSATVYGEPERVPIDEDAALSATNPYGRTKLVMEELIGDVCAADPALQAISLRYFNPVGAHPSGRIGESPNGVPNNLMPYVCQVAVGKRDCLQVFGGDWPTVDGTGVRDYIHVMDLARAHAHALERLDGVRGHVVLNLGVGRGISVLQLVRAFESASGREVPYRIVGRRAGDVAEVYADPARAERLLGWRAELDVDAMCRDAWRWQSTNPDGYVAG
ncbi:MAG: UDP-glucose 4-epimerase GalE [Pseudomonadota bacterium]